MSVDGLGFYIYYCHDNYYTIHSIDMIEGCVFLKIVYVYPFEYNIQANHICLVEFIYLSIVNLR